MNEILYQHGNHTNDTNLSLYLIAGHYNFLFGFSSGSGFGFTDSFPTKQEIPITPF